MDVKMEMFKLAVELTATKNPDLDATGDKWKERVSKNFAALSALYQELDSDKDKPQKTVPTSRFIKAN